MEIVNSINIVYTKKRKTNAKAKIVEKIMETLSELRADFNELKNIK